MSKQGDKAKARHEEQSARIDAMSDAKLKGTALTMVYLLLGERALNVLGYQKP